MPCLVSLCEAWLPNSLFRCHRQFAPNVDIAAGREGKVSIMCARHRYNWWHASHPSGFVRVEGGALQTKCMTGDAWVSEDE